MSHPTVALATPIVEQVMSRTALAGNPSDGYGGTVFAVPVRAFSTTVSLIPLPSGYELIDEWSGGARFERWSDLEGASTSIRSGEPHALLLAAVATAAGRSGMLRPCRLHVETSIPVSVGLAGSSAIIIAALRALMQWSDDAMSRDDLAVAAMAVETNRLRMTAGLQDRIVQVYGEPMLMQFDPPPRLTGTFTPVPSETAWRLLVAVRAETSAPSDIVHGDLRSRFERGDEAVVHAMPQLARLADDAADAYRTGDVGRLGAAMDATVDLRANMLDLDPMHLEMVTVARSAGASVNYTGSGGSVVVLCPSESVEAAARQSLKRLGCTVVSIDGDADGDTASSFA